MVADNVANESGGGLYSHFADVTFRAAFGEKETVFTGNRALLEDGGGLYANGGVFNLVDAVFEKIRAAMGQEFSSPKKQTCDLRAPRFV